MSTREPLTQVLLLADDTRSLDVAAPLWAALQEVEAFYRPYQNAPVPRWYLGAVLPSPVEAQLTAAQRKVAANVSVAPLRKQARGHFGRIDQEALAQYVREALKATSADHWLIVTDFEITPPREWRYAIWDGVTGGAVVSTAPVDPRYWRMSEDRRAAVLKHRVRTACLSITGHWLGLRRCDNESCFLYGDVDSATTLDTMVQLGPEHEFGTLAGRGFAPIAAEPERVQPVIDRPPAGELLA